MAMKYSPYGQYLEPMSVEVITELVGAEEAELELLTISAELGDVDTPLRGVIGIMRDDMAIRFETETDPDGNEWIPLDEEYLASKVNLGYPESILTRTSDLRKAATSIESWYVEDGVLFFTTENLPEYGPLHQTGSGEATNVGIAARHRARVTNEPGYGKEVGYGHTGLGIGRGNALPARPFIGMSEEAELEAGILFEKWFDSATHTGGAGFKVGSHGHAQQIVSGVDPTTGKKFGGRFGPRVKL